MFVIVFVYQTGLMGNANALTKYYNCTTRVANKNGTLSLQNIENCYDQVFKGAKQAEKDEASTKDIRLAIVNRYIYVNLVLAITG